MEEEKELALRKYAELHEHSKSVLAEEMARSHRIDEKASKYLSVLSLVLGGMVFFFQQLVDQKLLPPCGLLDCLTVLALVILFVAALAAWWFVFSSLRIHALVKPPMDKATVDFYDANSLIDIYYAMARGNMTALEQNKIVGDKKSQALYRGYIWMNVAVSAMALLFFMIVAQRLTTPVG